MSDQDGTNEVIYEREENECGQCGHYPSSCICGCKICRRNAPAPESNKKESVAVQTKLPDQADDTEETCSDCGHTPKECDCGCNECASNK